MKPKILKTEKDYDRVLRYIEDLMRAPKTSSRNEELDLWATLVEAYEKIHYPIADPDPIEAIKFRMDQMGLRPADLAKLLGGRSRVSEVLNRKRPLSVSMMRSLYRELHVPAESLLAEPSAKYR